MRRGGRLFLLLGLVIAAAAAVFLLILLPQLGQGPNAGTLLPPTQERAQSVVVARIDIPANTVLTDTALLTTSEIPESQYNANPSQYFTDINQLQTLKTISGVSANRPILASNVTSAGLSAQIPGAQPNQPQPKAFPVQVSNLSGVADQITSGDFVDIIASFSIDQTVLRPGFNDAGQPVNREQQVNNQSTKTLAQNVQVLRVLRPAPVEGTVTPTAATRTQQGPPPPANQRGQAGTTGTTTAENPSASDLIAPGNRILILAVTDQQAEVIKLAIERGSGLTLVLRRRGDQATETTIGATLNILISQFGLPLPEPIPPAVISNNQLTPVPTIAAPPQVRPTATP
jgi:pilus assembly protein CpaB